MQTTTSFLNNRSNSNDIEISQKVRLPGPLPEPESPQYQVLRDTKTTMEEAGSP